MIDDESAPLLAHKLCRRSSESPIGTLCNVFLLAAIRWQASDIHLEPFENSLRVRLNIDGHLRTSTIPTYYGEKCVIRPLKSTARLSSLDDLRLNERDLALLKKELKAPQGLILVTGPTGSGQTTSVHAGLNYINITTLEAPVEVAFFGINHIPVDKQGGFTFASSLGSTLRQDPDVLLVGEMRDVEVAATAMQAAQAGHLVISILQKRGGLVLAGETTPEELRRVLRLDS